MLTLKESSQSLLFCVCCSDLEKSSREDPRIPAHEIYFVLMCPIPDYVPTVANTHVVI